MPPLLKLDEPVLAPDTSGESMRLSDACKRGIAESIPCESWLVICDPLYSKSRNGPIFAGECGKCDAIKFTTLPTAVATVPIALVMPVATLLMMFDPH